MYTFRIIISRKYLKKKKKKINRKRIKFYFLKEKKILHIDRNSFYGAEGASLNLTALWKLYRPGVSPGENFGANRDWNIDLIPKFVMSNGLLLFFFFINKILE